MLYFVLWRKAEDFDREKKILSFTRRGACILVAILKDFVGLWIELATTHMLIWGLKTYLPSILETQFKWAGRFERFGRSLKIISIFLYYLLSGRVLQLGSGGHKKGPHDCDHKHNNQSIAITLSCPRLSKMRACQICMHFDVQRPDQWLNHACMQIWLACKFACRQADLTPSCSTSSKMNPTLWFGILQNSRIPYTPSSTVATATYILI